MDEYQPTLQQAATSPNVAGALQQLLLSRIPSPQQEQQQQQRRQDTLSDYQQALRSDPYPGYNGLDHSLYSWIGQMGRNAHPAVSAMQGIAAGGKFMGDRAALLHKGDVSAAQVGYNDALSEDKMDLASLKALGSAARTGGAGNGKYIQFSDDAGNRYIMNNATGQKEVIPASKSKLWAAAHKAAYAKAVDETMPDPEEYAINFANDTVAKSPDGVTTTETAQKPVTSIGLVSAPPQPSALPPAAGVPSGSPSDAPSSSAEDRKLILQQEWEMNKAKAASLASDPTSQQYQEALRNMGLIRKEMKDNYSSDPMKGASTSSPVAEAALDPKSIQYKDKRHEEQQKGYGDAEGKGLYKEREALTQLHGANSKILSQLNMLEEIYANPNVPEGELAPKIQALRSGLKSLGITVDSSAGPADLAIAISTGMSLSQKNADGHNLLPGAMSNYEDQLLQKMAPTLSLTQAGRQSLVKFMKEVATSNLRIAQEGSQMASSNKDMLPPAWNKRKERVMLEEMARLKSLSNQLVQGATK